MTVEAAPAPDAAVEALLRRRAADLARRRSDVAQRDVLAAVTVGIRAGMTLAVPTQSVAEARRVAVVPLPRATAAVPGLFAWQGAAVGLVDPAPLLGAAAAERPGGHIDVLIVTCRAGTFGLCIDDVLGTRVLYRDESDPDSPPQLAWVQAVTRDLVTVIDPERLCRDPQLHLGGGPAAASRPNS